MASKAGHRHSGCWEGTQAPTGVTFRILPRSEMLSLSSYFTSSFGCEIEHHLCVCDIHSSNFFFPPPENFCQQAEKENVYAA